jgi:hypothetical protein
VQLAALAAEKGQPEHALRLGRGGGGGARASPRPSTAPSRLDSAWQALGEQTATVTWAEGQALSLEEAVAEALDEESPA